MNLALEHKNKLINFKKKKSLSPAEFGAFLAQIHLIQLISYSINQ